LVSDPSIVITAGAAELLVAAMFTALHQRRQHGALGWWAGAWSLEGLRQFALILVGLSPAGAALRAAMLVAAGFCLVAGAAEWTHRVRSANWARSAAVLIPALIILPFLPLDEVMNPRFGEWPLAATYMALALGWSAWVFARIEGDPLLRAAATGAMLILAALCSFSALLPDFTALTVVVMLLVLALGFSLMLLDYDRLTSEVESQGSQLRSVFEGSGQNIAVYDASGRILRINPSFESLLGAESSLTIDEHLVPNGSDRAAFFNPSDFTSRPVQRVKINTRVLGLRDFDISVSRLPDDNLYMVFAFDVSKIVMLQRELEQARRLEAFGRIATGLSHDFNNVLNVIKTYVGLGRFQPEPTEALAGIEEATRRAQRLTQRLSIVGQKRRARVRRLRVDRVLDETREWLSELKGEFEMQIDIPDDDRYQVEADVVQVEQLLFNLISNARAVSSEVLVRARVRNLPSLTDGPEIVLEVLDRGPGIPAELRERIFEPFFSTHPQGTGLGLTAVKSIVEDRSWNLEIEDRTDGGTIFRVAMPLALPSSDDLPTTSSSRRRLRVLLVDDYPPLVELVGRSLERDGHRAVAVSDPHRALDELREQRFDVLITDLDMPQMTGQELMKRAWEIDPDLDVILISGYALPDVSDNPKVRQLPKPFTDQALRTCLRSFASEGAPG